MTFTLTGPTPFNGDVTLKLVLVLSINPLVTDLLPNDTDETVNKLSPYIVTYVPPFVLPVFGDNELIVGGATYVNVFDVVDEPYLVVTTTVTSPAA